jgi:hypothetical protein
MIWWEIGQHLTAVSILKEEKVGTIPHKTLYSHAYSGRSFCSDPNSMDFGTSNKKHSKYVVIELTFLVIRLLYDSNLMMLHLKKTTNPFTEVNASTSVHQSTKCSFYPSIHPLNNPSIHLITFLSIYHSIYLSIHSFIYTSIYWPTHASSHLLFHPSIFKSTLPSKHPTIL